MRCMSTAFPDRVPRDSTGHIDVDMPCVACNYNLRGLDLDGACPECGLAIERSIHGDLLRFADPAWVRTIASGANWIVVSILLSIVLGCVARNVGTAGGWVKLISS